MEHETLAKSEQEQVEYGIELKEKAEYAEPASGAVTRVIEAKNENVSGETGAYDRDRVFSHSVDRGRGSFCCPLELSI